MAQFSVRHINAMTLSLKDAKFNGLADTDICLSTRTPATQLPSGMPERRETGWHSCDKPIGACVPFGVPAPVLALVLRSRPHPLYRFPVPARPRSLATRKA